MAGMASGDAEEQSFEVTLDDFASTLERAEEDGGDPRRDRGGRRASLRMLDAGIRRLSSTISGKNARSKERTSAVAGTGSEDMPWHDLLLPVRMMKNRGGVGENLLDVNRRIVRNDVLSVRGKIWDALHCSPAAATSFEQGEEPFVDDSDDDYERDSCFAEKKIGDEERPVDQSAMSAFIARFKTLVDSTNATGTLDMADTLCLAETVSISESDDEETEEENSLLLLSEEAGVQQNAALTSAVSFAILGSSPLSDGGAINSGRHVLTPTLMDALRHHVPYAVQGDSFWLRYSLVQDGASLETLLSKISFSAHTFIAIETVHGEVFGSFTSSPWRRNGPAFFGSCESFLWRLSRPRHGASEPSGDSAPRESKASSSGSLEQSKVDILAWSGSNRNIQLLSDKMLAIGGGEPDEAVQRRVARTNFEVMDQGARLASGGQHATEQNCCWDFGLTLAHDLLSGTTDTCATFDDSKGRLSEMGRTFEVLNVEAWSLTPTMDTVQANNLERRHQFVAPLLAGPISLEMNEQLPKAA